ncbi:MAG: GntR family transcriptional regulator [Ruminococcus sp.]|nr:GntR family transcriptional regulator [Ruminococcus sp.]
MKDKKSNQVYRWCLQYIDTQRFSSNAKMPSENAIKRLFGFSRETIRAAYDQLEAEGYIKRCKGSGTFINKTLPIPAPPGSSDARQKIGLISQGRITSPSEPMIDGIQSVLSKQDVDLHVYVTDNKFFNERRLLETVRFQDYCGFIVDGVKSSFVSANIDYYRTLYQRKMPIIFYNNYYKELAYPKVTVNNYKAAHFLTNELIRAGHRSILGLFVYDNVQSIEKFQGMLDILYRHRISFTDDHVKWLSSDGAMSAARKRAIKQFLNTMPKATAIVCCNYRIYTSLMNMLSEQHLRVPDDYSVVCFDYTNDDYEKTGTTCTLHRGYDLGVHIAQQITLMIQNHSVEQKQYSYSMSPALYVGTSVRNLNGS